MDGWDCVLTRAGSHMQAGVPCQTNQHVCRAGLQCRCAQPPLGVDTTHARSASAAAGVRRRLAWNMKQQSAPCSPRRSSALAAASCCCVAGQGPSRKAPGANSTMRATSDPGNSSCGGGGVREGGTKSTLGQPGAHPDGLQAAGLSSQHAQQGPHSQAAGPACAAAAACRRQRAAGTVHSAAAGASPSCPRGGP